ncbi:hypothetical protein BC936DRAFT_143465 [Jimgerdemannia flammicorona]|uniref:Uncharacterized protein n=1 Tax=Jimgerdemannia flammicorona TaxID=994334 RepID=A0A432ZYU4_9FUNG|nr:hypothetical protein BC936DRAFT_143465 [Jimgerdemannia flammicorona]
MNILFCGSVCARLWSAALHNSVTVPKDVEYQSRIRLKRAKIRDLDTRSMLHSLTDDQTFKKRKGWRPNLHN